MPRPKKLSQRAREWWRVQGYDQKAPHYDPATASKVAGYNLGGSFREIPFSVYPTPTINPPRPRTIAAGYDRGSRTLRIHFRENGDPRKSPGGAVYDYYDVTPKEWRQIQRKIESTGRYINNELAAKTYRKLYGRP